MWLRLGPGRGMRNRLGLIYLSSQTPSPKQNLTVATCPHLAQYVISLHVALRRCIVLLLPILSARVEATCLCRNASSSAKRLGCGSCGGAGYRGGCRVRERCGTCKCSTEKGPAKRRDVICQADGEECPTLSRKCLSVDSKSC